MSYQLLPLVWAAKVGSTDKLVLLRLADHADESGTSIRPGVASVAAACGLTERAVQLAMRRLETVKILSVVSEADFRTKQPREYRLDLNALRDHEPRAGERGSPVNVIHRQKHPEPVNHVRGTGELRSPKPLREPSRESAAGQTGEEDNVIPITGGKKRAAASKRAPRLYRASHGCTIDGYAPGSEIALWAAEECPLVPDPIGRSTVEAIKDVWRSRGVEPKDFDATYKNYLRKRQQWAAEKTQGNGATGHPGASWL